jgi:hypothetical protein
MGTVGRSVRRHFKAELRAVRVPAPPGRARGSGQARVPRAFVDGLVRAAAVVAAAGSLVLLALELPRSTVLGAAISEGARQRTWEALLPRAEAVLDIIDRSF